jgi:hypothetical protein
MMIVSPEIVLLVLSWVAAIVGTWQIMRIDGKRFARLAERERQMQEGPLLVLEIVGHSGEVGRLQGHPVYSEIVGTLRIDDADPAPVRLRFDGAENMPYVEQTVILALPKRDGGVSGQKGWELTAVIRGARYFGPVLGPAE